MAYTYEQIDAKVEVPKGASAYTVKFFPRIDGVRVEPSGTGADNKITIYSPGGAERVAATNMTKTGTGDTAYLTYSLNASDTANYPIGENYRADITWKKQGDAVVNTDRLYFDVVLTPLPVPIDTGDLLELEPDLENQLTDLGGDTNARRYIARAWARIRNRIEGMGYRPALVVDRHRLIEPAIALSLAYVYRALARSTSDGPGQKAAAYLDEYNALWEQIGPLTYDRDDGGAADAAKAITNQRRWSL